MYTWCTCKDDNWWANSLLWFQTVILCCRFFRAISIFVAEFSRCQIFRCPFFPLPFFPLPFFRCRYFTHYFCVALFSYPLIFRCRFFTLSNFPVAVSSVTVFFQFPFLPLPFCRESHMHVTQVRAAFPIRLAGILSNCRTGRWLNFYLRLGACLHLNNWCEPTVYLRHWAKHLCPILFFIWREYNYISQICWLYLFLNNCRCSCPGEAKSGGYNRYWRATVASLHHFFGYWRHHVLDEGYVLVS